MDTIRNIIFILALFTFLLFQLPGSVIKENGATPIVQKGGKLTPDINFGNIPLYFIHNKGQMDKKAFFYAKTPGYTLWVTKEGLVFDSIRTKETGDRSQKPEGKTKSQIPDPKSFRDVSRLLFVGANKNPEIVPLDEQKLKINYFKGNDKSKWVGGVPTSGVVLYKNLYKNIDLKVYGIGKQIEYDWIVHPGGSPEDIKFEYENVKKIEINKKGDLDITTQFGKLTHKKPYAYQRQHSAVSIQPSAKKTKSQILNPTPETNSNVQNQNDRNKKEIKSEFKKTGKTTFGFTTGKYDKTKPLVIDPVVLAYSTYLGGNDYDSSSGIDVDSNGYVYVTGYTESSDFPLRNQYDPTNSSDDVFITKFDTTQSGSSSLLYSTYLGGSSIDRGAGISVDNSGIVYVTGQTSSTDFPILNQYQGSSSGDDAFLTKLDTTQAGTGSLRYSTYLGGSSTDYGNGIVADINGFAYVTGQTMSTDFPVKNQYQTNQTGWDAFVTVVDTFSSGSSSLQYSTYLGGNGSDYGFSVALDSNEFLLVGGSTTSSDFPTQDAYDSTFNGNRDAFLVMLNTRMSGAASFLASTYLGGSAFEQTHAVAVDGSNYVYISGQTQSPDFPTLNGYQSASGGGNQDAFLSKFNFYMSSIQLLYSTYLGGNGSETGIGLSVDTTGKAYLTGYTASANFPVHNAYQSTPPGGTHDGFVTKIDTAQSGASGLIWSTYLGGSLRDQGTRVNVGNDGYAYVTGFTESNDFPTENQYQSDQSGRDAFVTKLIMDYTVNASVSGGNGTVSPATQTIHENQPASITITPDPGYEIASITDNSILQTIANPYIIGNVQEDHTVVVTFRSITFRVNATVSGGNGSVSPLSQQIDFGNNAAITINPNSGYKIASITDNGVSKAISNPYVINNVKEVHNVVVTFKQKSYPPTLTLTGERKTERAWIITKDYAELNISITEHPENPTPVASYNLLKNVNGTWTTLQSFSPGTSSFTDTAVQKDISAQYKLSAVTPEGTVIAESGVLTL
ncbi:MAG: SBBP repeat-containing protein [Acidobacteriota bacterium]